MTLCQLVNLFEGQPGEKHDLEVSLVDVRAWHADQQAIMRVNNGLRDAMLKMRDILNATVK